MPISVLPRSPTSASPTLSDQETARIAAVLAYAGWGTDGRRVHAVNADHICRRRFGLSARDTLLAAARGL